MQDSCRPTKETTFISPRPKDSHEREDIHTSAKPEDNYVPVTAQERLLCLGDRNRFADAAAHPGSLGELPSPAYFPPQGIAESVVSNPIQRVNIHTGRSRKPSVVISTKPAACSIPRAAGGVSGSASISTGHRLTILRVMGFHGLCSTMQHMPPSIRTRRISR